MKWIASTWVRISDAWNYRNEPDRLRKLIEIYWRMLLGLACILIACAILYSAIKLLLVLGRVEAGAAPFPSDGGGAALDRADLQSILGGFAVREANYELLKTNPPAITDPSR